MYNFFFYKLRFQIGWILPFSIFWISHGMWIMYNRVQKLKSLNLYIVMLNFR